MPVQPGTTLDGNVIVMRLLTVSPSGGIWEGFHNDLGHEVAIKLASRDALNDDPKLFDRYRLESKAVGEIDSPNVVRIFADGETEDGTPFIVMERLYGGPLSERLDSPLTVNQADRLIRQVAAGLSAVHGAGIIHRNICPDTIFVTDPAGDVKLIDFGIVKAKSAGKRLTRHGRLLGNSAYLSPERASAKPPTLHADLWSLAVVAYQMLTGQVPFPGPELSAQLMRIIKAEYAPPTTVNDTLPTDIDKWFARSFSRMKASRFQTARDMATAFNLAASTTIDW